MPRIYQYVGPEDIQALMSIAGRGGGFAVADRRSVAGWIADTGQVLDPEGVLRIADRHEEHFVCADYHPVLSAGEMTFLVEDADVGVIHVTNQSTGYCPEPASWQSVAAALETAGFDARNGFDHAIEFRRCNDCSQIALVKGSIDDGPECAVCGSLLPKEWNF